MDKVVFPINKVPNEIYTGFYLFVDETSEEVFIDDLFIDSDGGAFISHMYKEDDTVIHDQLLIEGALFDKWKGMCEESKKKLMDRIRQERPDVFRKPKPKQRRKNKRK